MIGLRIAGSSVITMKTVQLAVQDLEYADSVRNVLLQDGQHRVHLVKKPDVTLGGVIMVDAPQLNCSPLLAREQERLVVVVQIERDDLSMVWDAGVRHVGMPAQALLSACFLMCCLPMSRPMQV